MFKLNLHCSCISQLIALSPIKASSSNFLPGCEQHQVPTSLQWAQGGTFQHGASHRARVRIRWTPSDDKLHTQTSASYFQINSAGMCHVMNYRYSSSLTITSASAQWYLPTVYHKYFIADSSSHFHNKSTFVLWVALISQTINENNSLPHPPNMRFKKNKLQIHYNRNPHLFEKVGIFKCTYQ